MTAFGILLAKFWREAVIAVLAIMLFGTVSWLRAERSLVRETRETLSVFQQRLTECSASLSAVNRAIIIAERSKEEFERLYKEELGKPPKLVTTTIPFYTDRVQTVITSSGCDESLAETVSLLGMAGAEWRASN